MKYPYNHHAPMSAPVRKAFQAMVKHVAQSPPRRRGGKGRVNRPKGYEAWRSMMRRCYDCKAHNYHRYGARGITVCDEWHYFNNFQADMGLRPSPLHQLDRIDNNGNYTKMNCRWATPKENCRNRSNNTIIEHDGRKLCVAQWAEESGIAVMTLISRMERGWPFAKCLAIDPSKYHQRQKVCKNGHDDWRTNPSGGRYCHQCRMEYKRKWCKSRIRIPAPPESRGGGR